MNHRMRVAVLRGGPNQEHEVSMGSGAEVIQALRHNFADRYQTHDIVINRDGEWFFDGVATKPETTIHKIDLAFNALHGTYGEDGKIQSFFEIHRVPFTGSGSLGSALGMNKVLSKKVFEDHGFKSPYWRKLAKEDIDRDVHAVTKELFKTFLLPAVIKPASSGSSVGVSLVRNYAEIPAALYEASRHGDTVMIEEYIPGIEATCGVVENFRGHELYALPPIEIRPLTHFFNYEAKYAGKSLEIVPATFAHKTKVAIEELARKIHRVFGLRHYSRSDFIIHPRRGIYVLEVNTLPGLTKESLVPKALRAVGSDLHELVDHLIKLAVK